MITERPRNGMFATVCGVGSAFADAGLLLFNDGVIGSFRDDGTPHWRGTVALNSPHAWHHRSNQRPASMPWWPRSGMPTPDATTATPALYPRWNHRSTVITWSADNRVYSEANGWRSRCIACRPRSETRTTGVGFSVADGARNSVRLPTWVTGAGRRKRERSERERETGGCGSLVIAVIGAFLERHVLSKPGRDLQIREMPTAAR